MVRKLKSEFTFGFELEGVLNTNVNSRDKLFDILNNDLEDCGDMHYDGSIRYSRYNGETSFEYASPIFNYTPSNVDKVLKCLDNLPNYGVSVNRSCGFHTHVSFDGIKQEDTLWFIFWLCASGKYENFRKLGRTNLYGARYAKFNFLDSIATYIKNYVANTSSSYDLNMAIGAICTNEKYRAIRIHPQGTIEWRGPRTFLNTPTHKKSLSFFKKLDDFISCFIESLNTDSVTVGDTIITKDKVLQIGKSYLKSITFKSENKISFLEKIVNNPRILDKMKVKELDKNRDIIITALDRYYWSNTLFKSKVLFNWMSDNGLDRYKCRFFDAIMLLSDAATLYRNGSLFDTLKTIHNKSYELNTQIYEQIKKWHSEGLYSNTIGLYLNHIFSSEHSIDLGLMFIDVIKNGLINDMKPEHKNSIIGFYESMYRTRATMEGSAFFTKGFMLENIHNVLIENGLI